MTGTGIRRCAGRCGGSRVPVSSEYAVRLAAIDASSLSSRADRSQERIDVVTALRIAAHAEIGHAPQPERGGGARIGEENRRKSRNRVGIFVSLVPRSIGFARPKSAFIRAVLFQ